MPVQKRFKTKYPGIYFIEGTAIGTNKKEKINYVNAHRDIVLTIYDSSLEERKGARGVKKQQGVLSKIKQQLAVPLVVVQN